MTMDNYRGGIAQYGNGGYVEPYGIGGFLKGLAKGVGSLAAGVGLNALLPGLGALSYGLGSGLFTGIAEKDLKKGILSGLTSYVGSKSLMDAGRAAQQAGIEKAASAGTREIATDVGQRRVADELAGRGANVLTHQLPSSITMPAEIAALHAPEAGMREGIKALATSEGRNALVDSLASPSNIAFVYPQMGQLSTSIDDDRRRRRGTRDDDDDYEEELRRSLAKYERQFGSNPWASMYGYRSGAIQPRAAGGRILDPAEDEDDDRTVIPYVPYFPDDPFVPREDEGAGEDIGRDDGSPTGGPRNDGPTGPTGPAIPRMMYPREIPTEFIPGLMPEYNYFANAPSSHAMDISGWDAGSDPFAKNAVADAIDADALASYLAETFPVEGMAEGGQVPGDANELREMTVMALLGQLPYEEATQVIEEFKETFGEEALQQLIQMVMAERSNTKGAPPKSEGMVQGPGGGMGDQVIADVAGADPVALSSGEFIVPADVVSMLGDGDSSTGAAKLDKMMKDVRQAKTGTTEQAPPLSGIMSLR